MTKVTEEVMDAVMDVDVVMSEVLDEVRGVVMLEEVHLRVDSQGDKWHQVRMPRAKQGERWQQVRATSCSKGLYAWL